MEIQFYTISEDMARAANDANSMSDYKQGSATEEYRKRVESVYAVVEKIKQKRPNLAEKAERMAGRYSKKAGGILQFLLQKRSELSVSSDFWSR